MQGLWIVWAMLAYGAVHSLLAAEDCKAWAARRWGWDAQRYRVAYNLVAVLLLLPVLALTHWLPDAPLCRWPSAWAWAGHLAQLGGLALMTWALAVTDTAAFLGLRPPRAEGLTTRGPYRWMRHPLYTGGLLVLWGQPALTQNQAALFATITLYLLVGARWEEGRLLAHFGPAYARYRRHTPDLSFPLVVLVLLVLSLVCRPG